MALSGTRLGYIDTNPTTMGYDYRQKVQAQQEEHDLTIQAKQAALAEQMAMGPERVQQQRAQTRLSTTNADVAEQTAPYDIRRAETLADQGDFNLSRDQQRLPYELRTDAANATANEADATVAAGTVGSRISAAASAASAAASRADEAADWKEEKFLQFAQDDPDYAEAWAAQNGLPVTPEMRKIIRDRRFMALSKGTMEALNELYPGEANIAERAQEYQRIMGKILAGDQADQGPTQPGDPGFEPAVEQPIPTVADAYRMMGTEDSVDPEEPIRGSSGRGGTGNAVYDRKLESWLKIYREQGLPEDQAYQKAAEAASGTKRYTPTQLKLEASKAANARVSGSLGSMKQKADEYDRFFNEFYNDLLETEGLADQGTGAAGTTSEIDTPEAAPAASGQTMQAQDGQSYPVVSDSAGYDALPAGSIYYHAGKQKFLRKQ